MEHKCCIRTDNFPDAILGYILGNILGYSFNIDIFLVFLSLFSPENRTFAA